MIGKMFLYNNEEWIVEEILPSGHRCYCRNYYSDRILPFYCDIVQKRIDSYEYDLMERTKKEKALVFKEEDEKILMKKIIKHYFFNIRSSDINENEIETLLRIIRKIK